MYTIIISKQAKKRLQGLTAQLRAHIAEHIHILGTDPDDMRLDVKKMKGNAGFRLRVGQWRVIFERDDFLKIIAVERIGPRGDVYK